MAHSANSMKLGHKSPLWNISWRLRKCHKEAMKLKAMRHTFLVYNELETRTSSSILASANKVPSKTAYLSRTFTFTPFPRPTNGTDSARRLIHIKQTVKLYVALHVTKRFCDIPSLCGTSQTSQRTSTPKTSTGFAQIHTWEPF